MRKIRLLKAGNGIAPDSVAAELISTLSRPSRELPNASTAQTTLNGISAYSGILVA